MDVQPYVIYRKEGTPFCDERFIGYGGNKAACLYELYLAGVSFFILPDDFLIHQSHPYAEKARKHERRYNRKLYTDCAFSSFLLSALADHRSVREELCFRYLSQFIEGAQVDQPKAKNLLVRWLLPPLCGLALTRIVQTECKKIKGFYGASQKVRRASLSPDELGSPRTAQLIAAGT